MAIENRPAALPRIYAWFTAVNAEDTSVLNELLAHGLPIDVPHPLRHSTALMEATRLGRARMVQWLLEHGATPAFLSGSPGATALHCALRCHQYEIALILANAMPDCAATDAYGSTPLHVLCAESLSADAEMAQSLAAVFAAKGCPLDAPDQEGTTALHHCVINDLTELAGLLLSYGANPNALIPDSQVSPLTIAALEKNIPMARLLIHFGADPQAKTREGTTALTIHPPLAHILATETLALSDGAKLHLATHRRMN